MSPLIWNRFRAGAQRARRFDAGTDLAGAMNRSNDASAQRGIHRSRTTQRHYRPPCEPNSGDWKNYTKHTYWRLSLHTQSTDKAGEYGACWSVDSRPRERGATRTPRAGRPSAAGAGTGTGTGW
ncbi:hypothetical protein E1281_09610 [Actinomadura sp. KC345]|nr:hypothetical protein E1281_09610 [Actinomadura sp. KC345]